MAVFQRIVILILVLFAGCQPQSAEQIYTMRDRLAGEPGTLNPMFVTDGYSAALSTYAFDALIDIDPETFAIKPELAERWEVSADKKAYTYFLRKNAKWPDGKPFTADDVVTTVETILDPKTEATVAREFGLVDRVEKVDDHTVRFHLKDVYFRGLIQTGMTQVLPAHILEKNRHRLKDLFRRDSFGTGAFNVEKWYPGRKVVLKANSHYWGENRGIKKVEIKFIADDVLAFQKLKKGELDIFLELREIQWFKQTNSSSFARRFAKHKMLSTKYGYIGWNAKRPYFSDAKVRNAMTHLLNRKLIVEKLKYGLARVQTGPFHPLSGRNHPDVAPLEFNVAKAKELLREAGWKDSDRDGWLDQDGKKFSFTLNIDNRPIAERIASIYKEDLKKVGIDMKIQKLEFAALLDKIYKKDFDAINLAWGFGTESDPFNIWHSMGADKPNTVNFVGYKNKRVDELIAKAQVEFDQAKRDKLYQEMHLEIHKDQPYTFLYTDYYLMAISKKFTDVKIYKAGYDFLKWGIDPNYKN